MTGAVVGGPGYVPAMADERLEKVKDDIARARKKAQDDGLLDDPDEPTFAESGTIHPELDDPTIAPG